MLVDKWGSGGVGAGVQLWWTWAPVADEAAPLSLRLLSLPAAAYGEQQRSLSAAGSMGSLDAYAAAAAGAAATVHLPPSGIYASSCRAFTWPLLAPQSQVRALVLVLMQHALVVIFTLPSWAVLPSLEAPSSRQTTSRSASSCFLPTDAG